MERANGNRLLPGTEVLVFVQSDAQEVHHNVKHLTAQLVCFVPCTNPKLIHNCDQDGKSAAPGRNAPSQDPSRFLAVLEIMLPVSDNGSTVYLCGGPCGSMEVHVIGSPFGCISSYHFLNCIVNGSLIDTPQAEGAPATCVVDASLLPGMEGGVVVGGRPLSVLGILNRSNEKNQFVVLPITRILTVVRVWGPKEYEIGLPQVQICPVLRHPSSDGDGKGVLCDADFVVKLWLSNGHWGSGVIIRNSGTIVTCGHLFEESGDPTHVNLEVAFPYVILHNSCMNCSDKLLSQASYPSLTIV